MILYLIRHGESTYNAEGRIQGQSDPELSELGRRQASAVARRLADEPIEAVYASPLRRASQTAELVAAARNIKLHFDRRLMEVDAGEFGDRMRDEVMRQFPGAIPQWRSGSLDFVFPGGESRKQLIERGQEAFLEIAKFNHEQVAVASHGGLLLAAMKAVLGLASDAPPRELDNASITQLRIEPDGRAELVDFNNVDHLIELDPG